VTDRLLTTREVAELLGFSTETVLRRFRAGELPGFRLGTSVLRFRESEVEAWLEGRREVASVRSEAYAAGRE
jgi:excisionase family DNA binding protein